MPIGSSDSGPNPTAVNLAKQIIRLAFVEDDDDYREAASGELTDLGFAVEGFRDGFALLDSFRAGTQAEIVLLDWDLPGLSGIDLLPRLRRSGIALPVVFLTGRSQPANEKLALDNGAVDFVDKARGVPILAQRLWLIASSIKKSSAPRLDDIVQCDPVPVIEKTLTDVNGMLRRRLKKIGLGELDRIIMTISPNGAGIIRSNCDAEGLRDMAAMLIEIANQMPGEPKLN